jgi:hypothetical protein
MSLRTSRLEPHVRVETKKKPHHIVAKRKVVAKKIMLAPRRARMLSADRVSQPIEGFSGVSFPQPVPPS